VLAESFLHEKRATVRCEDGFSAIKALLPPPERRALVLIDPPYELSSDYSTVITALQTAVKRFATGTYIVWYPLLAGERGKARFPNGPDGFPEALETVVRDACFQDKALNARLITRRPGDSGLYGSGLFVVNPPWPLKAALEEGLPVLENVLREGGIR
jgi:23S rRNA (adenine2030-N6)-methyltransferase